MMGFVNYDDVVGRALKVFEDFLLFQKINGGKPKRNMVKWNRAKLGAATDFVQRLPVYDLKAQAEAGGHFHLPLGEQWAGRRHYQNAVGNPPRNQFREQQAGLNGFAQANAVRQQKANAGHADGAEHGHELVRLDAQATGLNGAEGVHTERLLKQEGLMVGKPVGEWRGFFGAQLAGNRRDFVERAEEIKLLPGEISVNAAQTVENLRTKILGVNQFPSQTASSDFCSWEEVWHGKMFRLMPRL
jgi:hypothetical protein